MRVDNDAFNVLNQSSTKQPRYAIEIAFDAGATPTDLYYFTSHNDIDTPLGATVFYSVVNSISGTSQKLDVLNARATIGSISFKLQDTQKQITDLISTKLVAGDGLREKRVRFYIGDPGLSWSNYQLIQTQLIQTISISDDGIYSFRCSDIQRVTRKTIFDPEKVNLNSTLTAPAIAALTANVGSTDTTFIVTDTTGFTTSGKLYIDQEMCSYTGTTATTFTGITRAINGTVAASHLGSTGGDAVISQVRDITIASSQTNVNFELLEHGTSYADAPSQTVGYFKIGDEIFRYYSKSSATVFRDCVSGVLNTKAVAHEVDSGTTSDDRKPKIEEYIYLEMPILKLALAILTGDLDGQPGKTLPEKWHLGIDPGFVATSKYKFHLDLYDPSDDTLGFPTRFEGLAKTDGKAFLEKEIFALAGGFMPVLSDGQLSFSRQSGVLTDSDYVRILDSSNIISSGSLLHNMNKVFNQIEIKWNWDEIKQDTTRSNLFIDAESISRHQKAPRLTRTFRGLHGSIHSTNIINQKFNALRDRYVGPPLTINPTCLSHLNNLEIGDIVRYKSDNVRDYSGDVISLDRSFEIQGVNINWKTGRVRLQLFGSSEKANVQPIDLAVSFLADSYYTSTGTNIETAFPGQVNVTAGVLHIIGDITLTGNDNLLLGVFYSDKPMQVDANIIITFTKNVLVKVLGHLQIDGVFDGTGNGLLGAIANDFYNAAPGTSGYYGNTQSAGTISDAFEVYLASSPARPPNAESDIVFGKATTIDQFILVNATTDLLGLPQDLQGTSGSSGGGVLTSETQSISGSPEAGIFGGNGGNGGAGIAFITRGISRGINGLVRTNGNDGEKSNNSVATRAGINTIVSGSGAGGAPGASMFIMDGSSVARPDLGTLVEALKGATPIAGQPQLHNVKTNIFVPRPEPIYSFFVGSPAGRESKRFSSSRIYDVPADTVKLVDIPEKSQKPIAISIVELQNTPPTVAQNLSSLEITVTPPQDSTYDYTNFYAKTDTDTKYTLVGSAARENVMLSAMDGTTFDVRAYSVSIYGKESDDYVETSFTVSNQKGGAGMVDGNFISAGQTAFDVGIGFFLEATATGGRASFGDSAGDKVTIENGNVFITGTITATTGAIGGWKITATTIENTSGRIKLDSANNRIRVQNLAGTNYVDLTEDGLKGVDSVLGTTFNIPTDGSPPEFSSGVIEFTEYRISNLGFLRTSGTVGDGGANSNGVLLNDLGIKVFEKNKSVESFFANASDGTTTMGDFVNEKYAKFDGVDFKVGKESKFLNADSYSNDAIYYRTFFEGLDPFVITIQSDGNITRVVGHLLFTTPVSLTNGYVELYLLTTNTIADPDFGKKRKFKARMSVTNSSADINGYDYYIGTGAIPSTHGFGFHFTGGNIYGFSVANSSYTEQLLTTNTDGNVIEIEALLTPSSRIDYFVNGVNQGNVTANIPTGVGASARILSIYGITTVGTLLQGATLRVGEFKFLQDE